MKNVFISLLTLLAAFASCESSDNDLDEVIEEVDSCAGLDFESRVYVDGGVFGEFIAEGIVSESPVVYEWKINDEFVSNETVFTDNEDSHLLVYEFTENGSYEVTVLVETPECPNGTSFTETIVVDEVEEVIEIDSCAGLDFESVVGIEEAVFGEFVADGIISDSAIKYEWKINDEFVFNEILLTDNEDNHVLVYKFTENGSYEVTVLVETPECPNGTSYTETIVVDEVEELVEIDSCAGLDFESRVYADGGVFGEFVAEGIVSQSPIKYEWKINGEFVSNETVFTNNEDNHLLVYEFTENGNYEVTVLVETPECPNGTSYTKTITVNQVQ